MTKQLKTEIQEIIETARGPPKITPRLHCKTPSMDSGNNIDHKILDTYIWKREELYKKETQLKGNKEKKEGKKSRGRWHTNNTSIWIFDAYEV